MAAFSVMKAPKEVTYRVACPDVVKTSHKQSECGNLWFRSPSAHHKYLPNETRLTKRIRAINMRRDSPVNDEEPLGDKTHALPLRSKRTERLRKKQERKKHRSLEPKH